jgi:hypothetical protein
MTAVTAQDLPPDALLARYRDGGVYADCFVATVPGLVSQARYVEAFYTSRLFKLERLVLAWVVLRPSTDLQARRLAAGDIATFAAWSVEDRDADQILLCDYQALTRSWLMTRQDRAAAPPATTLYFGTAVAPRAGDRISGGVFRALSGLHRLYARALVRSTVARLKVLAAD